MVVSRSRAEQGTKLEIGATGQDADAALAALAELVEQEFDAIEQGELNSEGNSSG